MLYYEDGRFMRDQIFGFFALNYVIRHRNASCGRFFVDSFQHNGPEDLDDLRKRIENGDKSFVNSLTYFNQRIKGSSPHWFKKKGELCSWMHHHVESGNGAPMFFITLSCAEHFWPAIFRLIAERMDIAGEDSSQCKFGSPKVASILNDYSLVVQEYFQIRVETWIEFVGRPVFGIQHHWLRYEFAPGRGQIHAHMLAVSNHLAVYEMAHQDLKNPDGEVKRAERLSKWAEDRYGMTASVVDGFDDLPVQRENSPTKHRLSDLDEADIEMDNQRLMKVVQVHECNGFCLRPDKGKGANRCVRTTMGTKVANIIANP